MAEISQFEWKAESNYNKLGNISRNSFDKFREKHFPLEIVKIFHQRNASYRDDYICGSRENLHDYKIILPLAGNIF